MNPIKQLGAVVRPLLLCMAGAFLLLACQTFGDRSETYDSAELKLPATFKGTLPCADCEGIRYHLDLWPDGVFHLRQTYLGTSVVADDRGHWHTDPSRKAILLYGSRERKHQFEVKGAHTIRLLDQQGRQIQSSLPYDLTSDGTLTPTDLSLDLHGMFRYMADAAQFEDCLTGRSYLVAIEGDYIQLERAYLQAAKPEPGTPLMASFAGDITRRPAMEGSSLAPTVVVRRFIGLWPGQRCEQR
jgi:copper homeostasis protein (lipoprotein)